MLRSFLQLVEILNRILCENKKFNLMITDDEKKTMQELVEIFELFEEAVNICQVCFANFLNMFFICFFQLLFIFMHHDLLFT